MPCVGDDSWHIARRTLRSRQERVATAYGPLALSRHSAFAQDHDDQSRARLCRSHRNRHTDARAGTRAAADGSLDGSARSARPLVGCTSIDFAGSARGDRRHDKLDSDPAGFPSPCSRTRTHRPAWSRRSRSSVESRIRTRAASRGPDRSFLRLMASRTGILFNRNQKSKRLEHTGPHKRRRR